jgi:hypothetical protein
MADRNVIKPARRDNKQAAIPATFTPRFWNDCDSRLAVIRNIRSRYHVLREAVGGDISPQRDLLAQRIAFLAILIESAEVRAAEGGELDHGVYVQSVNALTGLLKAVGLERRVKQAGSLSKYLEQREQEAA